MFKICEIRSFSYIAGQLKLRKKNQYTFKHLAIERCKLFCLVCDLDLHFQFQMLKICENRLFSCCRIAKIITKFSNTHANIFSNSSNVLYCNKETIRSYTMTLSSQFKVTIRTPKEPQEGLFRNRALICKCIYQVTY